MLARWTWLLVFLSFCDGKGLFSVVAPQAPVAGLLGSSVSLPCTLSPTLNAVTFEVLWYRPNEIDTPVFFYKDQKIQEKPRNPRYWGRVSLSGGLEKGNVSLKLENFTLADKGDYICRVEKTEEWYDEATVSLQERVTGSPPVVSVADTGEGQVNVSCHSDGWSPEPSLSWTDREGQDLKYLSKSKFIKDSKGLVSVSSWLQVSSSESEWLSCSVGFSDSDPERKECRVQPNNCTVLYAESWKGAFITTLILLLLCITGFAVYFVLHQKGLTGCKKKKRDVTEETVPLNSSPVEKDLPKPEGAVIPYPAVSIAVEQESPEEQNLHTDQPTQIPTELDQVKKSKVDISIDSAEAPAFFRLTHGGKRIHCTHPKEDHEEEKYRIFTFCKEKFSSGKHYWEVQIGEKPKEKLSWYVGVMSETAENVYRDSLIPKNGFWVLCYEAERGVHFRDFPAPKLLPDVSDELTTVGVFLDCDEHTLSFYDVGAKSHIYTFTNMKSKTSLCPLISPGIRDKTPIRIC